MLRLWQPTNKSGAMVERGRPKTLVALGVSALAGAGMR